MHAGQIVLEEAAVYAVTSTEALPGITDQRSVPRALATLDVGTAGYFFGAASEINGNRCYYPISGAF